MSPRPAIRRSKGGFEIGLGEEDRRILGDLCSQLRELLVGESPASDPAVARLFPPAYPDDLLRNLDFERGAGDGLLDGRLAAIETVEATIDAKRLTEEQLLSWLGSANDLRLVLGTRLGVAEESTEEDFEGDALSTYELYRYLTWLVGVMVEALGDR